MKAVSATALVLLVIGGINWGLVGFFNYNFVDMLLGEGTVLARIVYGLVGLSAMYIIVMKLMPPTDHPKIAA